MIRVIACLLIVMLPAAALSADLEVQPAPKSTPAAPNEPAAPPVPKPAPAAPGAPPAAGHVLAPPDATCAEWTNGCRTCQRTAKGDSNCSNIGLACVAQPLRCTRR